VNASAVPRLIHVWANPAETPFPLTVAPVRIAVGTPHGPSSNSWRLWLHGADIYFACRDNFREFKASLHASGIWRFGLTEQFIKAHGELVPPGRDRAWKKWRPTLDTNNRLAIGFQVTAHVSSLYLQPGDRKKWPKSVVFVEHAGAESQLTVLSVCVVLSQKPVVFETGRFGAVVAVLPIDSDRTVQLVVTHENAGNYQSMIADGFRRAASDFERRKSEMPDRGVFFVHGDRGANIPYVSAVPFKRIQPAPVSRNHDG
jgi:hypothetical protein